MVEETKTLGRSGVPWKRHYERACEAANASVQTYVRSSAHMVLSLKAPSESKRLPTLYEVMLPATSETGKPLTTTNIFGHPLQIFSDDGQFTFPTAADPAGFAGAGLAKEGRPKMVFQVEQHPDFAPVVSSAQRITAAPTSTAEIPDYLARPLAVQLGLVADGETSKREHVQVTKLKAATSALENLQLRKETHHAYLLQSVLSRAAEEESPNRRRAQGVYSRHPLAAFEEIDNRIGRRVPADGWRGGVLPSLGADLQYAPSCELDPGSVTNVATRWFRHRPADRQGEAATGKAEAEKGGAQKSVPEFLPMLHQLCRQPIRIDRAKRPVVSKKETSRSLVIKGGVVPVEEETTGSPEVTVIRQQGLKAVVERLQFEGPPPPRRLPRKPKSTKELGVQTEAPRAPPPPAKVSMQRSPARVAALPPECERHASESSSSTEDSTLDSGETPGQTEFSIPLVLPDNSHVERHLSAELQEKSGQSEESCEPSSISEDESEKAISGRGPTWPYSGWQQPWMWYPIAMWNLLQQSSPQTGGLPNPVKPPYLQTPEVEQAEEVAVCVSPDTLPVDVLSAAFMPLLDGVRTGGGITVETAIPDPQQTPNLQNPQAQEPQQAGLPSWLYEEARKLFPPGFEQMLWESVLLQNPGVSAGFPVVQVGVKDQTNPWRIVCDEAQWEEQCRLYQQWQTHWQRQREAYLDAMGCTEDGLNQRQHAIHPVADGYELEKIEEEQQMEAQKIRGEFESFTRTQQFRGRAVGAQSCRGHAAIGNCRGGRRAWGVFDRSVRTPAERGRQQRMKMLPEVDDYFDIVPPPSLRRPAGEPGRVRGGRRKLLSHLNRSDWRSLRRPQERLTRNEDVQKELAKTYQEERCDESDTEWRNLEAKRRRRPPRQERPLLGVEVKRDGTDPEREQSDEEGRGRIDWYEQENFKRSRERKLDAVLNELAKYLGVSSHGDSLRHDLASLSHSEYSGVMSKEHVEDRKLRSTLAQSAVLKQRNRLSASEKVIELKRVSGLFATGKLPRETKALVRERMLGFDKRQHLFGGLLNAKWSHRHIDSSCSKIAASSHCEPLHHFLGKHLRSNESVFDLVEDTTKSKCRIANKQADAVTDLQQASCTFHVRGVNSETVACNTADKEAGVGASTGCFDISERRDNTTLRTRGRTLLDLSAATLFEGERQGEVNPSSARLAHHKSLCRPPPHPISCVRRYDADATLAGGRSSLKTRPTENFSPASAETVKPDHDQTDGIPFAGKTDSAGLLTNTETPHAPSAISECFCISGLPAGSATCVTPGTLDDTNENTLQAAVTYSEFSGASNTASGSTAVGSECPCPEYSHLCRRELRSQPFFKDYVEVSRRRPVHAAETGKDAKMFLTVHCVARAVDRLAIPPSKASSAFPHKMEKLDWKRRLAKWRTAAKNESRVSLRRGRPASFPWDEDVIPACRGTQEAAKSRAGDSDASKESLDQSCCVYNKLLRVITKGDNSVAVQSSAAQQTLPKPRGEKQYESFLRRKTGTGGGDYSRETGRRVGDESFSQSESTPARVPDSSSTGVRMHTDSGNLCSSWPQLDTKAPGQRSVSEKEGASTYSFEGAFAPAKSGRKRASNEVFTA